MIFGNRIKTKHGGEFRSESPCGEVHSGREWTEPIRQSASAWLCRVIGSAAADATVTVNDGASLRKGTYFRAEIGVDNSSLAKTPVYEPWSEVR